MKLTIQNQRVFITALAFVAALMPQFAQRGYSQAFDATSIARSTQDDEPRDFTEDDLEALIEKEERRITLSDYTGRRNTAIVLGRSAKYWEHKHFEFVHENHPIPGEIGEEPARLVSRFHDDLEHTAQRRTSTISDIRAANREQLFLLATIKNEMDDGFPDPSEVVAAYEKDPESFTATYPDLAEQLDNPTRQTMMNLLLTLTEEPLEIEEKPLLDEIEFEDLELAGLDILGFRAEAVANLYGQLGMGGAAESFVFAHDFLVTEPRERALEYARERARLRRQERSEDYRHWMKRFVPTVPNAPEKDESEETTEEEEGTIANDEQANKLVEESLAMSLPEGLWESDPAMRHLDLALRINRLRNEFSRADAEIGQVLANDLEVVGLSTAQRMGIIASTIGLNALGYWGYRKLSRRFYDGKTMIQYKKSEIAKLWQDVKRLHVTSRLHLAVAALKPASIAEQAVAESISRNVAPRVQVARQAVLNLSEAAADRARLIGASGISASERQAIDRAKDALAGVETSARHASVIQELRDEREMLGAQKPTRRLAGKSIGMALIGIAVTYHIVKSVNRVANHGLAAIYAPTDDSGNELTIKGDSDFKTFLRYFQLSVQDSSTGWGYLKYANVYDDGRGALPYVTDGKIERAEQLTLELAHVAARLAVLQGIAAEVVANHPELDPYFNQAIPESLDIDEFLNDLVQKSG